MLKDNVHANQEKCVLVVLTLLADVVVDVVKTRDALVLKKKRLVIAHLTVHAEMLKDNVHANQEKCVLVVLTLLVDVVVDVVKTRDALVLKKKRLVIAHLTVHAEMHKDNAHANLEKSVLPV
jgi:hypothetical protein